MHNQLVSRFTPCYASRCFADSLLKISGGIAIGIVASVAFFKVKAQLLSAEFRITLQLQSRSWPIWFGSGIGLGTGWSNCRHDLARPYILHGKKVLADEDTQVSDSVVVVEPLFLPFCLCFLGKSRVQYCGGEVTS
ncbi:unnamed protein product [Strongylus vulgaris]|uniref:MICOS complex subunit MIC10 n=1 Tax=Strongylus vulgaris TaxID=40348 RepID=A0A3P7JWR0_STRVU|nr:unnamed protein product [Strongylus vulgaris]